jgi:hypothetical protein
MKEKGAMNRTLKILLSCAALSVLILVFSSTGTAGNPHSAYSSAATNKVFWFIHTSDTHIGASGSQDTNNLAWLVLFCEGQRGNGFRV